MQINVPDDCAVIVLHPDGRVQAALPPTPAEVPEGATPENIVRALVLLSLLTPAWAEAREALVARFIAEQRQASATGSGWRGSVRGSA